MVDILSLNPMALVSNNSYQNPCFFMMFKYQEPYETFLNLNNLVGYL